MNIGLFGAGLIGLIAALAGGIAGVSWRGGDTSVPLEKSLVRREQGIAVTPESSDYLSVRPGIAALPTKMIDATEKADLLYMREEEKLARDVYITLHEKWNLPIFSNIAQSEQTHTEAVRMLLVKYNIADPVSDDTIGVFVDPTLQKLFADLTSEGQTSIESALRVGARVEDLDLYDLNVRNERTDNEDIMFVYDNLSRGSRNHLRSFVEQLASRGVTYAPEFISGEAYEAIINSGRETGGGGAGRGGGRGWGGR